MNYICSQCGTSAYYDGRMGDGPILMCGCDKGVWVDEGSRGGYHAPTGAKAVKRQHAKTPEANVESDLVKKFKKAVVT